MAMELSPSISISAIMNTLAVNLRGDFCWSRSFDKRFVESLMFEGFLVMCHKESGKHILLPKLHENRCLMDFSQLRVPKRIRQLAQGFSFSMDQSFDAVIRGIQEQHGLNWFYPPLVKLLKDIHL